MNTTPRPVLAVYPAIRDDIKDLSTVRPIPTHLVQMIDPFLFLNHHGPQVYPPGNSGLPFGPHPHRGFQTVTFILEGDIAHRDSAGHESVIGAGGVQWMSAGRGLIHEEVSSSSFMRTGGPLEILQLWVNLPARLKMSEPWYVGLQADQIPRLPLNDGRVTLQCIAGEWFGSQGAFSPSTDLAVMTAGFAKGGSLELGIDPSRSVFLYVVQGKFQVNDREVEKMNLVEFGDSGDRIAIQALEDSLLLLCHATPYREPVVMGGPFVMNTEAELRQAFADYHSGKIR